MMTDGIYLLLGSNMGDKIKQLAVACDYISEKCEVLSESSVYQTASWGKTDQPEFCNQILMVKTSMTPLELLNYLQSIELQMGRKREGKWGNRIIDIDMLYFHHQIIATDKLTIPHPAIPFRRFTLVPMVEINSDFVHPILGKTQLELLNECKDMLAVSILGIVY